MDVDFDQGATLTGTPPVGGYMRGGTLATGTLAKMVTMAIGYIEQGYADVTIRRDDAPDLHAQEIRELAARTDLS